MTPVRSFQPIGLSYVIRRRLKIIAHLKRGPDSGLARRASAVRDWKRALFVTGKLKLRSASSDRLRQDGPSAGAPEGAFADAVILVNSCGLPLEKL
jgi:hypothetical protein